MSIPSSVPLTARPGPPNVNPRNDYADVSGLFRHLMTLEGDSIQRRRERDAIIERCLPLADHIARRFTNRGEPFEDLVQVSRLGLINAVDRFDIRKDNAGFLAFAVPTMMGAVRRHFRDHGWSVRVPRRLQELSSQVKRASEQLTQQIGRTPTVTEIASQLEVGEDEVLEAQAAASVYAAVSSDAMTDTYSYGNRRAASAGLGSFDPNLAQVLEVETVRTILAALPQRERAMLGLRFFENMTQAEIAAQLSLSQMHVSRLLTQCLAKLRRTMQMAEFA